MYKLRVENFLNLTFLLKILTFSLFLLFPIQVLCTIVAVLLHYFFTAVFGWMFVEGVHLYTKVVRVFSDGKSCKASYYILGWGKSSYYIHDWCKSSYYKLDWVKVRYYVISGISLISI